MSGLQRFGQGQGLMPLGRLTLAALPLLTAALSVLNASAQPMWVRGEADSSCGEYVQAVEGEHKARPPYARPDAVYDIHYEAYLSAAEGFLSGANSFDPVHRMVGQGTDIQAMMLWLEKYCRDKPLDKFLQALLALRVDLIDRSDRQVGQ